MRVNGVEEVNIPKILSPKGRMSTHSLYCCGEDVCIQLDFNEYILVLKVRMLTPEEVQNCTTLLVISLRF
jgi:hypothetical protein